jgi:2-polyprenyl-6-methoxyphenol hydroxylase-like FAD-dependent oxidoreductase
MTSIENVLVVGGGIAGLTAATALARAGVSVDVVELADRPAGAAITVTPGTLFRWHRRLVAARWRRPKPQVGHQSVTKSQR